MPEAPPLPTTNVTDKAQSVTQTDQAASNSYLEPVLAAMRRLKESTMLMSQEVEEHNQYTTIFVSYIYTCKWVCRILDQLDGQVDATDARMGRANERAHWIYRNASWRETWMLTLTVILLFLILFVLIII